MSKEKKNNTKGINDDAEPNDASQSKQAPWPYISIISHHSMPMATSPKKAATKISSSIRFSNAPAGLLSSPSKNRRKSRNKTRQRKWSKPNVKTENNATFYDAQDPIRPLYP
jgi:hypothetical protein